MSAYSHDLRQRVLNAALRGDATEQAVANRFGVSRSFVQKLKRLHRTKGSIAPSRARRGPRPRLTEADLDALERWLDQDPDATGADLADRLARERDVEVSRSTVNRAIRDAGLRSKKKTAPTVRRPRPLVAGSRSLAPPVPLVEATWLDFGAAENEDRWQPTNL
ncbi:helix-turn-helix domain-containing protein [Rubrivirga marina]|uniref:Transposase Synechocystis PCC 6803 domain-containing protein n=1 Tax=Rubrivirga marina TaxID=1196024 RepID=A0A271IXJ3_9BACT|nr:helix-turn-helix domain-containing protein [Rubrivirga marina]PAP75943.1 hypothetical protein BSZ37_05560 [Rubrivirga marina]